MTVVPCVFPLGGTGRHDERRAEARWRRWASRRALRRPPRSSTIELAATDRCPLPFGPARAEATGKESTAITGTALDDAEADGSAELGAAGTVAPVPAGTALAIEIALSSAGCWPTRANAAAMPMMRATTTTAPPIVRTDTPRSGVPMLRSSLKLGFETLSGTGGLVICIASGDACPNPAGKATPETATLPACCWGNRFDWQRVLASANRRRREVGVCSRSPAETDRGRMTAERA